MIISKLKSVSWFIITLKQAHRKKWACYFYNLDITSIIGAGFYWYDHFETIFANK